MLNRIMLSAISLTTLTAVVAWPASTFGMMRPLSASNHASIQFSNGQFNNGQFTDQSSDDLSGLMVTGCSQFSNGGPQVCLQWLGDALTTCLEWGDDAVVTACMQKGRTPGDDSEGDYAASSASQSTSRNDWGFSVELTLQ